MQTHIRSVLRPAHIAGVVALLTLTGCGGDSPTQPSPYDADTAPEDVSYDPELVELGVDFDELTRTQTGLYYRDLEVGGGEEAMPGDSISVAYSGWLPDGEEFDSGIFEFQLQGNPPRVIGGWDEGLEGVRVGGHRLLVIPWWLAYGASGSGGVIPPYAPLVFEVELLSIE